MDSERQEKKRPEEDNTETGREDSETGTNNGSQEQSNNQPSPPSGTSSVGNPATARISEQLGNTTINGQLQGRVGTEEEDRIISTSTDVVKANLSATGVAARSLPDSRVDDFTYTKSNFVPVWSLKKLKMADCINVIRPGNTRTSIDIGASTVESLNLMMAEMALLEFIPPKTYSVAELYRGSDTSRTLLRSWLMEQIMSAIDITRKYFGVYTHESAYTIPNVDVKDVQVARLVERKRIPEATLPHPVLGTLAYGPAQRLAVYTAMDYDEDSPKLGIIPGTEKVTGARTFFGEMHEVMHPFQAAGIIYGNAYYNDYNIPISKRDSLINSIVPPDVSVSTSYPRDIDESLGRIQRTSSPIGKDGVPFLMACSKKMKENMIAIIRPLLVQSSLTVNNTQSRNALTDSKSPVATALSGYSSSFSLPTLYMILFASVAPNFYLAKPEMKTINIAITVETVIVLFSDTLLYLFHPLVAQSHLAYSLIPRIFRALLAFIPEEMNNYLNDIHFSDSSPDIREYSNLSEYYQDLPHFVTRTIPTQYPFLHQLQDILRMTVIPINLSKKTLAGTPSYNPTCAAAAAYVPIINAMTPELSIKIKLLSTWVGRVTAQQNQRSVTTGFTSMEKSAISNFCNTMSRLSASFAKKYAHGVSIAISILANSPLTPFTPTTFFEQDGRYSTPLRINRRENSSMIGSNQLTFVVPDGFALYELMDLSLEGMDGLSAALTKASYIQPDFTDFSEKMYDIYDSVESTLTQAFELNVFSAIASEHYLAHVELNDETQDWIGPFMEELYSSPSVVNKSVVRPVTSAISLLSHSKVVQSIGGNALFLLQPSNIAKVVDILQSITPTMLPEIVTTQDDLNASDVLINPTIELVDYKMVGVGCMSPIFKLCTEAYGVNLVNIIANMTHPDSKDNNLTQGVIISPRRVTRNDPFNLYSDVDMYGYALNGQCTKDDGTLWPEEAVPRYLLISDPKNIPSYINTEEFPLQGYAMIAIGGDTPIFDYVTPDTNLNTNLYLCDHDDDFTDLTKWERYNPHTEKVIIYDYSNTIFFQYPMFFQRMLEMTSSSTDLPGNLTLFDPLQMVSFDRGDDRAVDETVSSYFSLAPGHIMKMILHSDLFSIRSPADITDHDYLSYFSFTGRKWIDTILLRQCGLTNYNVGGQSNVKIRLNQLMPDGSVWDTNDEEDCEEQLMSTLTTFNNKMVSRFPMYDDKSIYVGWPKHTTQVAPPSWAAY